MRLTKAAILMFAMFSLCGCMGREPNDLAYVVALGFDKADSPGNYIMTIQFARPTNISGGSSESGGSGQGIVENIAVEAPNIYAGIALADQIVSKKLSLAHSKLIVFSEDVAREGISDVMETFARNEELRPDVYMAVSLGSARDYLFKVKPVVEVNPARYYQLIYEQHYAAGIPKTTAVDFYYNDKSNSKDNVLPLAGTVNEPEEESESGSDSGGGGSGGGSEGGDTGGSEGADPSKTENKSQSEAPGTTERFEYRLRDYIAGQVAVNQNNKSETMGMAYFSDDKFIGKCGSVETQIYNMLVGYFEEAYLTLMCDKQDPVTVLAIENRKPRYKIDKDKREINIDLYFESDLYSLPTDYLAESGIDGFQKAASDEITQAAEKFINDNVTASGADLLGLRSKFKRCFLTNKEFEEKKDEIMDYNISVNVVFRVRRTGLTVKEAETG